MIKSIKTCVNGESFLFDKVTNNRVRKYDPYNENICLLAKMEDGSILQVENKEIKFNYGGLISFDYKDDKYIIDDGYQDLLIRTGYLIMDNYDMEHVISKPHGIELRSEFLDDVKLSISNIFMKDEKFPISFIDFKENKNQQLVVTFKKDIFEFKLVIDTINNIVAKNQQRKINNLAFYPFEKNMDKYGTLFVTVFAKVEDEYEINDDKEEILKEKYNIAESVLKHLIESLNNINTEHEFRYQRIIVKKRINYWEGI